MLDTELRLSAWRDGSTQAERLAAAALRLSGYSDIDPQSPLGGPDGTKDLVCSKGGLSWVGAVYFPSNAVTFAKTKKKFKSDLAGVTGEHRGFVFVTNQNLSPTQRRTLTTLATTAGKEADILHLERLRTLLDSPTGYGTRIQFLRIPMSSEEQIAWFSESDTQTASALSANTRELNSLRAAIDQIGVGQADFIARTRAILTALNPSTPDLLSSSTFTRTDKYSRISATLDIPLVLLFHRLVCFDLPTQTVGRFRTSTVWLSRDGKPKAENALPIPPSEIESQISELCRDWQANFKATVKAEEHGRLVAVALFHMRFLAIHPFSDGNGRTGRAILMQQCLDLFGKADMSLMDRGSAYYSALNAADEGDTDRLVKLLCPVVRR